MKNGNDTRIAYDLTYSNGTRTICHRQVITDTQACSINRRMIASGFSFVGSTTVKRATVTAITMNGMFGCE